MLQWLKNLFTKKTTKNEPLQDTPNVPITEIVTNTSETNVQKPKTKKPAKPRTRKSAKPAE